LKGEGEVRLAFDDKAVAFTCDDGGAKKTFPIENPASDLQIDFHANQPAGTANEILIGGVAEESQPIPFVTFYPDGTCSPFHIQFRAHGADHIVTVDPWTCAPMLPPPVANGS